MKEEKKIILSFDLDFTLIDNREGIVNSFNYALKKYNLPEVNRFLVEKMIGMPLDEMFINIHDANPLKLTIAFREYYGTKGIHQVKLIPGVMTKLKELKENSFTLGVITSKKLSMAVKLLKNLKIHRFFDYILGETEEIKNKTDPILIRFLFDKYPEHEFVVIGDHPKDKKLAEKLNCPFIGVLTGKYSTEQLKQESNMKILILNSVADITIDKLYSLL